MLTDGTHAHDGIHGKKGRHSAQVYMCTGVLSVVKQDTHVCLSVIRRHASFLCVQVLPGCYVSRSFVHHYNQVTCFYVCNVLHVLDIITCYAIVCQQNYYYYYY